MRNLQLLILVFSLLASSAGAQTVVKGYILDSDKEPLVGVNIQIKGTAVGTISDSNGNFQLEVPSDNSVLIFSYTGFESEEREAGAELLEVVLQPTATALEEVVVAGFVGSVGQARRRLASLQSIPESVTTLDGGQIALTGVHNVQSFAALVPNVSFQSSQTVGVNFINVRGIAQIRNGEAPVAFVIDGVTIPDANLLNQELYDLAMIEVVKGPQGTLYGKNAIGGAINILTMAPTNYFKNRITVGYGNGNSFKTQLTTSGPLVRDKIYYRIAGSYKQSDGLIRNETLNETVDFLEDISLRGQLKFDLNRQFSATLTGQYFDTEGGAVYYAHSPGGLQMAADDFDYVINGDQRGEATLNNSFAALKLEYNFGGTILRSITSYNQAERSYRGDLDFLPLDILRQMQDSDSETFNQELRLSSAQSGDALSWDLGAFYQDSDKYLFTQATADFGYFAEPVAPTGQQAVLATLSDFVNNYRTIALFGFVDYKLSEKLTLSAGLRIDNDRINQRNDLRDTRSEKSQSEWQPKISVAYQAQRNVLLYGNYGRGYRSGGYNADATDLFDEEYKGEISNNFELGCKASSADQRFIFETAAFYVGFRNQQQYAVAFGKDGLVLGNYNLPETAIFGFEASAKYRTSRYLDILTGYGYTTSKIQAAGSDGTIDRSGFVGNFTPFVPQSTFHVGLQSTFPIAERIDFLGFVNLSRKGEMYWHEDNIDIAPPYSLLNGRLGISVNNTYDITIWANNLTNTVYYQEYFAGEISGSAAGDIGWVGQPRSFGLELAVRF